MKDKAAILRRCALFARLSPEALAVCATLATVRRFGKGEVVFEEGAPAHGFYIVADGRVKVYKLSAAGEEHILHIVEAGGSFAEAVVFGPAQRYPAFAEAIIPTYGVFIPKGPFLDLLRSDFSLTLSVLASLNERLRAFTVLIEELSLKDADARLARYLLDGATRARGASFVLPVRKVELARHLGIAPETLSRVFGRFRKKRLLRMKGAAITLRNSEALARIASGR